MTRVLVTGSAGFTGRHFRARLAGRADVTALWTARTAEDGLEALELTDAEAVDAAVAAFRPDCVVHLAAQASLVRADQSPASSWRSNVDATINLALAVARHVPESRFVFASTAQVYGRVFLQEAPVDETSPIAPEGVYPHTKAAAEMALRDMLPATVETVVLRSFNQIGAEQERAYVTATFAAQVAEAEAGLRGTAIRVGNLAAVRDFLDVRDFVRLLDAVATGPRKAAGYRIYNVGSGNPVSIGSILERLRAMSTVALTVDVDPALFRPIDVPYTAGAFEAVRKDYDWCTSISLERSLEDILAHWRRTVGTRVG